MAFDEIGKQIDGAARLSVDLLLKLFLNRTNSLRTVLTLRSKRMV